MTRSATRNGERQYTPLTELSIATMENRMKATMDNRMDHRRTTGTWRLGGVLLALAASHPISVTPLTAQADSAAIPIITANAPVWGPGDGWTIRGEPLVEIGAVTGAPEHLLDGVVGAVRLSGGDIVIAERASGELRRYNREGVLVWRVAGQGEGPGEHQFLGFMGSLPGDSLVTFDHALLRVQVFSPGGEVVRTLRVEIPGPGLVPRDIVGLSEGHLVVTFNDRRGEAPPPGVARWPRVRISTLSLDDGRIRTVMDVPGSEVYMIRTDGRVGHYLYPFGKGPRFSVSGDQLALVDTESFEVRSIALKDGSTTRIVRRDEPAREVKDEHVEAWIETSMSVTTGSEGMPESSREGIRSRMREYPMASTLPVLHSIHLDKVGNLWVEPFSPLGSEIPPFQVYSPDGTWLGSVTVPPGLALQMIPGPRIGRGPRPGFEIRDDYILGVWRDELDVEYVRLYHLEKSPAN